MVKLYIVLLLLTAAEIQWTARRTLLQNPTHNTYLAWPRRKLVSAAHPIMFTAGDALCVSTRPPRVQQVNPIRESH